MRKNVLLLCAGVFLCASARADSIPANIVAQEIKQDSALPLRQGVAQVWARNLLTAQDDSVCDYCGLESLQLSIQSVLRAIVVVDEASGARFCDLLSCWGANLQSTIAINPNATVSITPSALYFGEVLVVPSNANVSEPSVLLLLACGLLACLVCKRF